MATILHDMHKSISNEMGYKFNRFCSPLADIFGVNHFYHCMLTEAGGFASIGTNQDWHECLFTGSDSYLSLPYLHANARNGIIFTQAIDNEYWKNLSKTAIDEFNVHLGLRICVQTDEGQEGFGFGLETGDPHKHMAFLNQLPMIHLFINEYRKRFGNSLLKDHLIDAASLVGPSFYECRDKTSTLRQQFLNTARIETPSPFTKRENEVIRHLLNGLTAPKIAENIFLSKRTVEHHLERIKDKLDCGSKSDLIQKLRDLEGLGYRF